MGASMVIDPIALKTEIDGLADQGIEVGDRLTISPRAALILPTHKALDGAREGSRGSRAIGTTGRGIGPAYQDVAQRRGLRAWVLQDQPSFERHARGLMETHNRELESVFGAEPVDVDAAIGDLLDAQRGLEPLVGDVGPNLRAHHERGEAVLFEGAQGVMLDIVWGTYPFVTSSSCLPASAAPSCGVGPRLLGSVIGVMKAYVTRVGGGPFPTEDHGPEGEAIRERGHEFGTTTGRPRRCGWFDVVAARHAIEVAGIDALAITKLDVLDGLERLKVAVAYENEDGAVLEHVPADSELLSRVRPRYVEVPGWKTPCDGVVDEGSLPAEAEAYLQYLEEQLGVPVVIVSTGPRRSETMTRGASALADVVRPILESA
jgi:adenylosuccinate synthase